MHIEDVTLVAGRTCGECTVCCGVAPIDTPEFQKPSGVLCRFCAPASGCSIHATRPPVCREWFCGWRQLPLLDDAWRPDRSGVMIALGADPAPAGSGPYRSTKFIVTGQDAWLYGRPYLSYLAGLVHAGAATWLATPGPVGRHSAKSFLNPSLAAPVARSDGRGMVDVIRRTLADLRGGSFEPVVFEYDAPLNGEPLPPD